ncbi:putative non-inhibitory serpin-10 [Platanthera guangdongensis]|uniref:Non-inhibitory serpin-10 n=1 Tax=Platanthera guangdongensis TaxID=2320717 RepID=A0ABR2M701_9ASPA
MRTSSCRRVADGDVLWRPPYNELQISSQVSHSQVGELPCYSPIGVECVVCTRRHTMIRRVKGSELNAFTCSYSGTIGIEFINSNISSRIANRSLRSAPPLHFQSCFPAVIPGDFPVDLVYLSTTLFPPNAIMRPPLSAEPFTRCLQIAELAGIPAVDEGSNFVFSPISLVAALSLTASGARGETLRELLSFLGSPNLDHLHSASARLAQAVRADDRELILSFVNGAWVDRSMRQSLVAAVAASVYRAAIEPVDFIHQASLEQKKINNWIEEKTNGIIKNLIPDDKINQIDSCQCALLQRQMER